MGRRVGEWPASPPPAIIAWRFHLSQIHQSPLSLSCLSSVSATPVFRLALALDLYRLCTRPRTRTRTCTRTRPPMPCRAMPCYVMLSSLPARRARGSAMYLPIYLPSDRSQSIIHSGCINKQSDDLALGATAEPSGPTDGCLGLYVRCTCREVGRLVGR